MTCSFDFSSLDQIVTESVGQNVTFDYSLSSPFIKFHTYHSWKTCDLEFNDTYTVIVNSFESSNISLLVEENEGFYASSSSSSCSDNYKFILANGNECSSTPFSPCIATYGQTAKSILAPANTYVEFEFSGLHNMYEFKDKESFFACDFAEATLKFGDLESGTFVILLAPPDGTERYYGCRKGNHCEQGSKFSLGGSDTCSIAALTGSPTSLPTAATLAPSTTSPTFQPSIDSHDTLIAMILIFASVLAIIIFFCFILRPRCREEEGVEAPQKQEEQEPFVSFSNKYLHVRNFN